MSSDNGDSNFHELESIQSSSDIRPEVNSAGDNIPSRERAGTVRVATRSFKSHQVETKEVFFTSNSIHTAKYNIVTFLPKNLLEQFQKLANCYFLIVAVLQTIPAISNSDGQPTILVPLVFVLAVSATKDALEDYKRHKSDSEENNKTCLGFRDGQFQESKWRDLKVGQIVKIREDEYFPADLLLLNSSEKGGICYVETKNLDGETNLKHKSSLKELTAQANSESAIQGLDLQFSTEDPNDRLYEFMGTVFIPNPAKTLALTVDQVLLRGSSLRNTGWVYGAVVYTGHETKIMLNSTAAKAKHSTIERIMNKQIIMIFLMQMAICAFAGIMYASLNLSDQDKTTHYLDWDKDDAKDDNWIVMFFLNFGTWVIIFTNFVPISLLVTLELVKFGQALFISWDEKMYNVENDMPTKVQSSNLNEELGQIHYIFSDKTGTLTCNEMEFKKMSVKGVTYGRSTNDFLAMAESDPSAAKKQKAPNAAKELGITNVDFEDPDFDHASKDKTDPNFGPIEDMLRHLALCHTVLVEQKDGKMNYQASSPDELALVNVARFKDVMFQGLDEEGIMKIDYRGKTESYELLNVLEFNSARKRMSVILRYPNGQVRLLCKGADNIIIERLAEPESVLVDTTNDHLENYAKDGLRTLLLAQKDLTNEQYEAWNKKFQEAYQDIIHRNERVADVSEEIEQGLELVGATAIEDKLQDDVGITIKSLKDAGIKVWVLTGDKIETAINIGYSCQLLTPDMDQIIIDEKGEMVVEDLLIENKRKITSPEDTALIISGAALTYALRPHIRVKLLDLSQQCSVVIACRVSPKQKAEVVRMVKELKPGTTTLAIGDGANDVNMITAAHLGIGISGKEGQQAVRASDYAIGQFSFLRRLLFVHGREAYRRNSTLVCYNFWKNIVFVIPMFWFGIVSMWSGQPLYDPWIYQFFNVFYAALPIVLYALFDRDQKDLDLLEQDPQLYIKGLKGELFNSSVFWQWVIYGGVQGLFILIICFGFMENTGFENSGYMEGLWATGALVYTAVVVVVNFKVLHFTYAHYWFTVLGAFGGIGVYLISMEIISSIVETEFTGVEESLFQNPNTYMALIVIAGTFGVMDMLLWRSTEVKVKPKSEKKKKKAAKKNSGTRDIMKRRHTGYAFSAESGHTPQILEKQRGIGVAHKIFSHQLLNMKTNGGSSLLKIPTADTVAKNQKDTIVEEQEGSSYKDQALSIFLRAP